MIVAGCLLVAAATVAATVQGWVWGLALGDRNGVIGYTLGALILAAGIFIMVDIS